MRRKEKEIKDFKEIETILKENIVCHLALSDHPFPYIIPLNYGYLEGNLYFHCAAEGRKMDIIHKNPAAAFEVSELLEIIGEGEKACVYGAQFKSVTGKGIIEIVEDDKEKREALNILMNQIAGENKWHYGHKNIKNVSVLRLKIESMSGKQSL